MEAARPDWTVVRDAVLSHMSARRPSRSGITQAEYVAEVHALIAEHGWTVEDYDAERQVRLDRESARLRALGL